MRVLHLNYSDSYGGAARAAYRIHRSIVENSLEYDLDSRMQVVSKLEDDFTVSNNHPLNNSWLWKRIHPKLNKLAKKNFYSSNKNLHSIAWPDTGIIKQINQVKSNDKPDIIHLHWLGDSTISIEEIGRIAQPLVWTLHDQWPFCGAEHYTISNPQKTSSNLLTDYRYIQGYKDLTIPSHDLGRDLNRRTWLRKQKSWRKPINLVATTKWLADCASKSELTSSWPISVIPYPINLDIWSPYDKCLARKLFNLPLDCPLILFGAIGGTKDYRKGADLLIQSIKILEHEFSSSNLSRAQLLIFGESKPEEGSRTLTMPINYLGRFSDDLSLRLLYCAADVMVVPSRQEAFGQTASEAQACGTPVVAFRTGGLVDVVEHQVTGHLADPFDAKSLAMSIKWVLDDPIRLSELKESARQRAECLWNPKKVSAQYFELYKSLLN